MQTKVVHCKKEKYDIYIGRPSIWGNPFSHLPNTLARFKVGNRKDAILKYEAWIKTQPNIMKQIGQLRGKTLGCWCSPKSCHGDVLAKLAEEHGEAE